MARPRSAIERRCATHRIGRRAVLAAGAAGVAAVAGCLSTSETGPDPASETDPGARVDLGSATLYRSPGCSCCERYASYLQERADGTLETVATDDLAAVRAEHGVPAELAGCHTVVLPDHVVEGHVPVAAIGELLDGAPELDGVALPGMPRGSPGMPGEADELVVYAVGGGRTGEPFARV